MNIYTKRTGTTLFYSALFGDFSVYGPGKMAQKFGTVCAETKQSGQTVLNEYKKRQRLLN